MTGRRGSSSNSDRRQSSQCCCGSRSRSYDLSQATSAGHILDSPARQKQKHSVQKSKAALRTPQNLESIVNAEVPAIAPPLGTHNLTLSSPLGNTAVFAHVSSSVSGSGEDCAQLSEPLHTVSVGAPPRHSSSNHRQPPGMVHLRKPRSFGADGWLKVDLPQDEDAEWFRRVRNIVTSQSTASGTAEPAEVAPGVYLGHAGHAQDRPALWRLGVTHVLNCATAAETHTGVRFYSAEAVAQLQQQDATFAARPAVPSFEYLELGATDDELSSIIEPYLAQAVAFIDAAQEQNTRVLVHCVKGINRSSALCVAYLMKRHRTPLLTAVRTVWERRPRVLTNEAFCRELTRLGRKLGLLEPPTLHSAPVTVAARSRPKLEDLSVYYSND